MSDLPGLAGLAATLHPHTGALVSVEPTERGNLSDLTALVMGEKGEWFVKAVRNRAGGRRDSLVREGLINPFVRPISPTVLWQAESPEWIALGFEAVRARHADLSPGSPDVPEVVDVLNRIALVELPDIVRDWPETRWDGFADDAARLLRGDALLYTDLNPDNILIGDQATWAVDWSWPTRGAAHIPPSLLVVQLIATGHSARSAEEWADGCTAWRGATPEAVDAFAAAVTRMHRHHAECNPGTEWLQAMASAAEEWADHRGVRIRSSFGL
ncbi:protein kinase [Actinomadura sp. 6K520]|uniref:protein kinase n=1 Tax=Actinomadura sp. 6K520 TaxID=2530364 RepID=UPI00104E3411|nr:protein kinase [Actinomadura sp. 6K520]TDE25238.1 protein kinase [Actinomadura sp. 6K520]